MNIKIINYPYKDHQVGDIVDLGEELNKSLISFERATWVTHSPDPIKTAIKNVVEAVTKPQTSVSKKKLHQLGPLKNALHGNN